MSAESDSSLDQEQPQGLGSRIFAHRIFAEFGNTPEGQDLIDGLNDLKCFQNAERWLQRLKVAEVIQAFDDFNTVCECLIAEGIREPLVIRDKTNLEESFQKTINRLDEMETSIAEAYRYFVDEGKIVPNNPGLRERLATFLTLTDTPPLFKGNGVWRGTSESPDYAPNEQTDFLRAVEAFQRHIIECKKEVMTRYHQLNQSLDFQRASVLYIRRIELELETQININFSKISSKKR